MESFDNTKFANYMAKKPIGVHSYNYDVMINTLNRNAGDAIGKFDGYGTPIGMLSDPMYNTNNYIPTYKIDEYKNSFTNYIDYVEHILLTKKLSLNKWFNDPKPALVPMDLFNSEVGVVHDYDFMSNAFDIELLNLDTLMGRTNNYYLANTLASTATYNTMRNIDKNSISYGLYPFVGLMEQNAYDITSRFTPSLKDGRIYTDLIPMGSPIDFEDDQIGNDYDLSSYSLWISSLNNKTISYLLGSLKGMNLYYDSEELYNYENLGTEDLTQIINDEIYNQSYLNRIVNNVKSTLLTLNKNFSSNPNDPIEPLMNVTDFGGYSSVSYDTDDYGNIIRYDLGDVGSITFDNNYLFTYAENSSYENYLYSNLFESQTCNSGIAHGKYITELRYNSPDDLVNKTNDMFKKGKIKTIIARFHTADNESSHPTQFQTAVTDYGMSKGRNLLKDSSGNSLINNENSYDNPYCRVWTFHHQYKDLTNTIRPLTYGGEKVMTQKDLTEGDSNWKYFTNIPNEDSLFDNGRTRLDAHGVMNKVNGLLNIAPTSPLIDGQDAIKVKNCMFSIENLAWKGYRDGEYGLSDEQKGPMGGRIMWFPPYDLKFSENVSVNWNATSFIGRGEDIYTYTNTKRSGNLSFSLLIDHPSIVNYWDRKNHPDDKNKLEEGSGNPNEINTQEQKLLRFFAGCDILSATPFKPEVLGMDVKYPEFPQLPIEEPIQEPPSEDDDDVIFCVFYPNNYSGVDDSPNGIVDPVKYLINGSGTQLICEDNKIDELETCFDKLTGFEKVQIGYEMGNGSGISSSETDTIPKDGDKKVYSGKKKGRKYKKINDTTYLATNFVSPNKFDGTSEWFYRVDKRYEGQRLLKGNYTDNKDYGLNSSQGRDLIIQKANLDKETQDKLYSFTEICAAINDEAYGLLAENNKIDPNRVETLIKKFEKYKNKSISGSGWASSHGKSNWNNELNKNRCSTIFRWIKAQEGWGNVPTKMSNEGSIGQLSASNKDINDIDAKMYRAACFRITFKKDENATIQEKSKTTDENVVYSDEGQVVKTEKFGDIFVPNKVLDSINKACEESNGVINKEKRNEMIEQRAIENPYQFFSKIDDDLRKRIEAFKKEYDDVMKNKIKNEKEANEFKRYDNESYFFRNLKLNDPFLHHKIIDKVKYFDPAFHSITPEGFNARLNFLHQCTRQGSTYSANENGLGTQNAANMAFGTPPIVVIRVGDFYYTRAIIDSMSLDYEQWDLNNPEYSGVQPMICHVSLSFTFLGGSDLGGAISRLQNALSFNYYANTSVYDNRAEMVEYDDDSGNVVKFKGNKY